MTRICVDRGAADAADCMLATTRPTAAILRCLKTAQQRMRRPCQRIPFRLAPFKTPVSGHGLNKIAAVVAFVASMHRRASRRRGQRRWRRITQYFVNAESDTLVVCRQFCTICLMVLRLFTFHLALSCERGKFRVTCETQGNQLIDREFADVRFKSSDSSLSATQAFFEPDDTILNSSAKIRAGRPAPEARRQDDTEDPTKIK